MKQTINVTGLTEPERLELVKLLAKCEYAAQLTKTRPPGQKSTKFTWRLEYAGRLEEL